MIARSQQWPDEAGKLAKNWRFMVGLCSESLRLFDEFSGWFVEKSH